MANKALYSLSISSLLPERDCAFLERCMSHVSIPDAEICPVSQGENQFQGCPLQTWPTAPVATSLNHPPPRDQFSTGLSLKPSKNRVEGYVLCAKTGSNRDLKPSLFYQQVPNPTSWKKRKTTIIHAIKSVLFGKTERAEQV